MRSSVHPHEFTGSSVRAAARISVLCSAWFLFCTAVMSARATDSFSIDWFTIDGGGALMSGGDFTLNGTTGQPDTGMATLVSGEQFLKAGFWAFDFSDVGGITPTLQIQLGGLSEVTLSWYPDTPGFLLQQSLTLMPDSWTTLSTIPGNPAVLPVTTDRQFFRLIKP